MRKAFVEELVALAERDSRVVLLTGDLGYTVLEPFADRFEDRFYNLGVAEQNMIGVATGMAEAGYVPFVYSIATFATMRAYEFIRNGPVLHELPVRIVGVGGGFDYSHNGVTHYALEDLGLMRAQPGLTVIAPADPGQVRGAMRASAKVSGPLYLRVGKDSELVPGLDGRFELGRISTVGTGEDVALVACGAVAREAVAAIELLGEEGILATVAIVPTLAPAPVDDLVELLRDVSLVVTVEAHYVTGGLGSLVSEVVAEHGLGCRVLRRGVDRTPRGETGSQSYLHAVWGLDAPALATSAQSALQISTS